MMAQSVTINTEPGDLLETWKRFYNGPFYGMIDVESAMKEMPWLVGHSDGVTLDAGSPDNAYSLSLDPSA